MSLDNLFFKEQIVVSYTVEDIKTKPLNGALFYTLEYAALMLEQYILTHNTKNTKTLLKMTAPYVFILNESGLSNDELKKEIVRVMRTRYLIDNDQLSSYFGNFYPELNSCSAFTNFLRQKLTKEEYNNSQIYKKIWKLLIETMEIRKKSELDAYFNTTKNNFMFAKTNNIMVHWLFTTTSSIIEKDLFFCKATVFQNCFVEKMSYDNIKKIKYMKEHYNECTLLHETPQQDINSLEHIRLQIGVIRTEQYTPKINAVSLFPVSLVSLYKGHNYNDTLSNITKPKLFEDVKDTLFFGTFVSFKYIHCILDENNRLIPECLWYCKMVTIESGEVTEDFLKYFKSEIEFVKNKLQTEDNTQETIRDLNESIYLRQSNPMNYLLPDGANTKNKDPLIKHFFSI